MSTTQEKLETIKKHIDSCPDFPKPGILFRDVFSVLQKPAIFVLLKDVLVEAAKSICPPIECVVALDARGFLFGPLIALELKIPFVPVRKKGKLPGRVKSVSYSLEYGHDTLEIQENGIKKGQRVLIVDDLLATGGTLKAACDLVEALDSVVASCLIIMELKGLKGRERVSAPIQTLITYC